MKKFYVVFAVVIAISLVGCSSKQENKMVEETTEIIAAENSVNSNKEAEAESFEEKDVPAETEAQQTIEETENTNETEPETTVSEETVPETTIDKKDTTSDIESEKQTTMEQPIEEISSDKESSTGSGQKYIIFTADGMSYEFDKKIDVNWAISTYGKSNILWIDNGDEVVQIADNGEVGTTKKNNTEVVDGVKWNHNYDAYVPYYQGEKEGYVFCAGILDYVPEAQDKNEPIDQSGEIFTWGDVSNYAGSGGEVNHAPKGTFYTTSTGKKIVTFDDYMALSPEEQAEWDAFFNSWFY